jgi:hypothetical protein
MRELVFGAISCLSRPIRLVEQKVRDEFLSAALDAEAHAEVAWASESTARSPSDGGIALDPERRIPPFLHSRVGRPRSFFWYWRSGRRGSRGWRLRANVGAAA